MAKNSRVAVNRGVVTDAVLASLRVHGEEIAMGLQALFNQGRSARFEVDALLHRLALELERAGAELLAADLAHATELADDHAPRQARDEATAAVREKLLGLRDLVSGAFGEPAAAAYHLREALPELPAQLLQRGRNVQDLLEKQPFTTPPRHRSLKLKAADLAEELKDELDPLDAALKDVKREEREAQATQEHRNRATEEWQRVYLGVTHMAYGAYILAGRRDLAERIEPTSRRRAGIEEPTPAPAPGPEPTPAPPPA
jgi:hypothetical protein